MEENPLADLGIENKSAEDRGAAHGDDLEYDEAHDVPIGLQRRTPAPHRIPRPKAELDQGGDYGYDEAHDFGAS